MTSIKYLYPGIFLIALSTLMYEILLTRIFSVTTWYHFAFLAISLAMLGMTAGAILVYLKPNRFTSETTAHNQALSALLFGLIAIFAIVFHISLPMFMPLLDARMTIVLSLFLALPLLLAAFICSGVCVSLTLTRFPDRLPRLYGADLLGAAAGCIAIVYVLQFLDGITAVFFVGFLSALSAVCFALSGSEKKILKFSSVISILLAIFVGVNASLLAQQKRPLLFLFWSKGEREKNVMFERWSCFSRIRVFGDPDFWQKPLEFGYSLKIPPSVKIQQLWLDMDGHAAAIMYHFRGNLQDFDFFKYDITNLAYSLIKDGNVLVIGVGGGKDILAALTMHEKSITGVEINKDIINTVNGKFGDYTGHLDKSPTVTIVNDEARSFITRSKNHYDLIQATLVDTYAASASGAYALTENSLYTADAWEIFLNHLTDRGILTVSRWYSAAIPAEMYRLTALAWEGLRRIGVDNPRQNIIVVRNMKSELALFMKANDGLGTILVKRTAYTPAEIDAIEKRCDELGVDLMLSPRSALDPNLALAAEGKFGELSKTVPFNITPPTDNCPYFFQNLKPSCLFDPRIMAAGRTESNVLSSIALIASMVAVMFFTFYCFRLPLLQTKDKAVLKGTSPLFIYFFGIGIGFMLIEMSQLQRFSIFLGHPIYSMSVVLFTLLLSTGIGSLLLEKLWTVTKQNSQAILLALLAVSLAFGFLTPIVTGSMASLSTPERISIAGAILFPLGLVLGFGFPLGMKHAFGHNAEITPWLWGINGAASVCGSVLAVLVSMFAGISCCYWLGFAAYVLAFVCVRKLTPPPSGNEP